MKFLVSWHQVNVQQVLFTEWQPCGGFCERMQMKTLTCTFKELTSQ